MIYYDGNRGKWRVFSFPKNVKGVWGSNDDINWTKLTNETKIFGKEGRKGSGRVAYVDYDIDTNDYYKYHAIVADNHTQLTDTSFHGFRKQESSTLHDGALTLTKNLDVPRIGPPLDADDTPRRGRLVVEYNTSTNPTFDGAVRDTSGRGNDGIMYTATYDSNGKEIQSNDRAGTFNTGPAGTASDNNYGSFETIVPSLQGNPVFTVSGWFKQNTVANLQLPWLIGSTSRGVQPSTAMSWFGISSAGQPRVAIGGGGNLNLYYTTGSIQAGKWYHMVITVQPSGTSTLAGDVKFYLDGVSQSTSSTSGTSGNINLGDGASPKMHWFWQENSTVYYDGSASNIKLYDTALTASEVKTLYDMGRCDEGGHVVNFSKTRVGIGLGDGEAPRGALDVRGDIHGGNPVFFTAYASGAGTSGSSSGGTVIQFNKTLVNKGGAYDISNGRCTFPISGYYEVFFRGGTGNSSSPFHARIYRNGNAPGSGGWPNNVMRVYDNSGGVYRNGGTIQFFYYFTAGEYIEVRMTEGVFNANDYNSFSVKYLSN